MKRGGIQFSAPVCITLAGGSEPFEPTLMCALDEYVSVKLKQDSHSALVPPQLESILAGYNKIFPQVDTSRFEFQCDVPRSLPVDHLGVQAALIVTICACLQTATTQNSDISTIQKTAYLLEKKLFQLNSHAQTTTSCVGGIVFYRKEFSFHKTVFHIPIHIPRTWIQGDSSQHTWEGSTETYIRRCIAAIMREDFKTFSHTFNQSLSDLPKKLLFKQSAHGLRRIL